MRKKTTSCHCEEENEVTDVAISLGLAASQKEIAALPRDDDSFRNLYRFSRRRNLKHHPKMLATSFEYIGYAKNYVPLLILKEGPRVVC